MSDQRDIDAARRSTKSVYERKARYWHAQRSRQLYERPWLDRFSSELPPGSRILDLACGTGRPLADYFLERGFLLTGVDYAEPMIEIARAGFPGAEWVVADLRQLPELGHFDGICSWDGFFHLSVGEQRTLLPQLRGMLRDCGSIILTVGTGEGEVTGTIDDETVYHASLSPEEYERTLTELGFSSVTYVKEDPSCFGRSVLLARRTGGRK
ncbi:MAG: class I SAM-dependent methyltransferase [Pseudomonadota bacterium]